MHCGDGDEPAAGSAAGGVRNVSLGVPVPVPAPPGSPGERDGAGRHRVQAAGPTEDGNMGHLSTAAGSSSDSVSISEVITS